MVLVADVRGASIELPKEAAVALGRYLKSHDLRPVAAVYDLTGDGFAFALAV